LIIISLEKRPSYNASSSSQTISGPMIWIAEAVI